MAISIGQYTPVFLPEEPPDREAWQATVYRIAKLDMTEVTLCARNFFACGSSAPMSVEHEDGAAAWTVGTLAALGVQGHGLPLLQELWPYQSLFSSLL